MPFADKLQRPFTGQVSVDERCVSVPVFGEVSEIIFRSLWKTLGYFLSVLS